MNLNKYDQPKDEKPKLQDWKASVPVVVLSEALKIVGKKYGIVLYLSDDGRPTLHLNPGMGASAIGSERWNAVEQIRAYFLDAADDLRELISTGKINLPRSPRRPHESRY